MTRKGDIKRFLDVLLVVTGLVFVGSSTMQNTYFHNGVLIFLIFVLVIRAFMTFSKTSNKLISCFPLSFSKRSIVTYAANIALVLVVFAATTWVIHSVYPFIGYWFLSQSLENTINLTAPQSSDRYNAVNLTSSLVSASVTIIYVIFTAFIFNTTNKNTEQTANSQKIALLERKLELFYIPMENALKMINMTELRDNSSDEDSDKDIFRTSVCEMFVNYLAKYDEINRFRYLANDEINDKLEEFYWKYDKQIPYIDLLLDNFKDVESWYFKEKVDRYTKALPNEDKFFNYYTILRELIKKDINTIKDKLEELVNL